MCAAIGPITPHKHFTTDTQSLHDLHPKYMHIPVQANSPALGQTAGMGFKWKGGGSGAAMRMFGWGD